MSYPLWKEQFVELTATVYPYENTFLNFKARRRLLTSFSLTTCINTTQSTSLTNICIKSQPFFCFKHKIKCLHQNLVSDIIQQSHKLLQWLINTIFGIIASINFSVFISKHHLIITFFCYIKEYPPIRNLFSMSTMIKAPLHILLDKLKTLSFFCLYQAYFWDLKSSL